MVKPYTGLVPIDFEGNLLRMPLPWPIDRWREACLFVATMAHYRDQGDRTWIKLEDEDTGRTYPCSQSAANHMLRYKLPATGLPISLDRPLRWQGVWCYVKHGRAYGVALYRPGVMQL